MSAVLPQDMAGSQTLPDGRRWAWLPAVGTWQYHLLLISLGALVLGPLGGVTASYMNFSIGFFVGGQVLAGILGSTVTYGYGPEGKHGANFIQTAAASVAGMSAMGVLIQAMVWMGLPQPPIWALILYMLCIGMFGMGVGMLYTPILVDKMKLTYPSGLAVANILRALTDPVLLKKSIALLGTGIASGIAGGVGAFKIAALGAIELSTSTFGAGMLTGARVGIPAVTGGLLAVWTAPYFVSIGWLEAGAPPRKIMFLIALGTIMGAAIVDLALIFVEAFKRWTGRTMHLVTDNGHGDEKWRQVNTKRLAAWVAFWGAMIVVTGHYVLNQPILYIAFALVLVFLFTIVNGISIGITDQNPISSAFVVSIVMMAAIGLTDPIVGLMAGTVLLVSVSVAGDMQQDRSTGWRLGSNRVLQFRYQAAGILAGAVMAVVFAKFFMAAYPVLLQDQTVMTADQQPAGWASAMTYKLVGVLRSLTDDKPYQRTAIWIGVGIGFAFEFLRKLIKSRAAYKRFVASGRAGFCTDFTLDAIVLPSPYALSFGGFVNLHTSLWLGAGGIVSSFLNSLPKKTEHANKELPADMSGISLFGGGLIAGDALAALGIGLIGLAGTLLAVS